MDGATADHSDSDSGESWTLLENSSAYGDTTPDLPENAAIPPEGEIVNHSEKDEDTDGISIISDSDPESSPCDLNDTKLQMNETASMEQQNIPLLEPPTGAKTKDHNESAKEETDYLGDNVKFKTYVHKRNPKVGTVLDIIMLGTLIITAGMALGHLWSCKNECNTQVSVNKILSNLYKLQEENAYLRNKLKEISQVTSYQLGQQKKLANKQVNKQQRCKKIFEEPIMKNNKAEMIVKCVDDVEPGLVKQDHTEIPEHEKEFLSDINKMKEIYDQNRAWLDEEVKKQYDAIANSKQNNHKPKLSPPIKFDTKIKLDKPLPDEAVMSHREDNLKPQLGPAYYQLPINTNNKYRPKTETIDVLKINLELQMNPDENPSKSEDIQSAHSLEKRKITYADSLKTDQPLQREQKIENKDKPEKWTKDHSGKKKRKDDDVVLNLNSFSEDDIKKDDRYTGPKIKHEKKKHDRQKSHKKQKRQNKYEQWEMKGGYLKDFDEFSVTSSLDNDISVNKPDKKFLNPDFENYMNKLTSTEANASNKNSQKKTIKFDEKLKGDKRSLKFEKGRNGKGKDSDWYDKRSALRAEARMKVEQELFGENISNNAAWYFRRMQKREQCRTQKDNSTFKKFSKRKMNFKTKR